MAPRYHNPTGLNNCTAWRPRTGYKWPARRCAVCGRYRKYHSGFCWMYLGYYGSCQGRLGNVCPTCQDTLYKAGAITQGSVTGSCSVLPGYRLKLRELFKEKHVNKV